MLAVSGISEILQPSVPYSGVKQPCITIRLAPLSAASSIELWRTIKTRPGQQTATMVEQSAWSGKGGNSGASRVGDISDIVGQQDPDSLALSALSLATKCRARASLICRSVLVTFACTPCAGAPATSSCRVRSHQDITKELNLAARHHARRRRGIPKPFSSARREQVVLWG